jgi:molybdate transport system permease protein
MFKRLMISASLLVLLMYSTLIGSLLYFFDADTLYTTLTSGRTLYALQLSLGAATAATLLALLVALPTAYALSRYRFPLQGLIDTLLELPMIVSPAALGAMLLIFFNTPYGQAIQVNTGQVVFTIGGVVVAQFVTTLGLATRLIKAVLDEIPVRYEQVARTLGTTPWQAFRSVTFPLALRGLVASVILTWAKAIGEFGATITLAGSMAMKTETLPVAIFMKLSMADIEGTVVLIFILIGLGMLLLTLTRKLTA